MQSTLLVLLALTAAACGGSPATSAPAAPAASTDAGTAAAPPAQTAATPGGTPAATGQTVTGVVAETMNAGGYTYARLTSAAGDTWVATAEMPIEKGARLTATVSVAMQNFHSRTLDRDFAQIAFVQHVLLNGVAVASNEDAAAAAGVPVAGGAPSLVGSHGGGDAPAAPAAPAGGSPKAGTTELVAKVDPAPGGMTVLQVWQTRADLSGKPVVVRARVVKANYEIMGSNWYHVQDGSGDLEAGTHDLTVTSSDRVAVGDVVTVSGPISLGRDFGAGYAYDVMVERATIRK